MNVINQQLSKGGQPPAYLLGFDTSHYWLGYNSQLDLKVSSQSLSPSALIGDAQVALEGDAKAAIRATGKLANDVIFVGRASDSSARDGAVTTPRALSTRAPRRAR